MNVSDLYRLGRCLTGIARGASGDPSDADIPAGEEAVLADAFDHPRSSIGDITARTRLAQSYVSATVRKMREAGVLHTEADPNDRRRTLVTTPDWLAGELESRGRRKVDDTLAAVLGHPNPAATRRVVAMLDELVTLLAPGDMPGRERSPRAPDGAAHPSGPTGAAAAHPATRGGACD